MHCPVFEHLPAFIDAWLAVLDRLETRDGQIVFAYATRQHHMTELAAVHSVSRERIRQIVDHHFDAISERPERTATVPSAKRSTRWGAGRKGRGWSWLIVSGDAVPLRRTGSPGN